MVSKAGTVFDADGQLFDDKLRGQLQTFVNGFVEFVRRRAS